MYIPKHFKETDWSKVEPIIRANSFATLISVKDEEPIATHLPLELLIENEEKFLCGHISKANPQCKILETEKNLLTIFNGPNSYISSSWYDHENVPTWNYVAIHIYGKATVMTEPELYNSLKRMVDHYEKNSVDPIKIENFSEDFLKKEMKGIIGFKIKIEKWEASFKLSQNRDKKNYYNIIHELDKTNDPGAAGIAENMRKLDIK